MRPTVLGVNNYHYLRGGSERYFLELGALLARQGHRVLHLSTVHAANEPAPGPALFLPANELGRPGPLDVARFHYSPRAARAVRRLAAEERPDVAHLHIYHGQLTASILAPLAKAGIPIVQTLHEYRLACPVSTFVSRGRPCEACRGGRFWRAATRRCNRGSLARSLVGTTESYLARALGVRARIDRFLAPSEFLRRKMIAHGLPEERLTTLPYFVDAPPTVPEWRGLHFLYFGRLERLKGVLTLVEAAREVPEVPLLLAGEGEARAEIEARLREPGLGHVRLLGFRAREELFELVRSSLCVLVPSEWYDNLPLVVLEAMAHARAVIATDIGGIPEMVRDGATGWLVRPGDAGALAERLRFAAEHPDEVRLLGAAGRRRALEEYSPAAHYRRLLAVYSGVARGGP